MKSKTKKSKFGRGGQNGSQNEPLPAGIYSTAKYEYQQVDTTPPLSDAQIKLLDELGGQILRYFEAGPNSTANSFASFEFEECLRFARRKSESLQFLTREQFKRWFDKFTTESEAAGLIKKIEGGYDTPIFQIYPAPPKIKGVPEIV